MAEPDAMYSLAEAQGGYFSTAQAGATGISRQLLHHHLRSGAIQRASHGIYRVTGLPISRFDDVIAAVLRAGPDAVASHGTALAIYGIGDTIPVTVHLTIPRPFRSRQAGVTLHIADLVDSDRSKHDDVPISSIERTLADIAFDPATLARALPNALASGLTSARRLRRHGHTDVIAHLDRLP